MMVCKVEMAEIINGLSCNKSPGLDGIKTNHIKFADPPLVVYSSCTWLHAKCNPRMYRLIDKDNSRVNDKGNYRCMLFEQ